MIDWFSIGCNAIIDHINHYKIMGFAKGLQTEKNIFLDTLIVLFDMKKYIRYQFRNLERVIR